MMYQLKGSYMPNNTFIPTQTSGLYLSLISACRKLEKGGVTITSSRIISSTNRTCIYGIKIVGRTDFLIDIITCCLLVHPWAELFVYWKTCGYLL